MTRYDGITFRGCDHPSQHPNGGRLPGSIGAQEAQYPACFDCQSQVFDCGDFSEVPRKVERFNHCHGIPKFL
jgi:hypothetical protein